MPHARQADPHQHQNGAEGHNDQIAREDDQDCEDADGPESAQLRGDTIVGWRGGSRFDRDLRISFRQRGGCAGRRDPSCRQPRVPLARLVPGVIAETDPQ